MYSIELLKEMRRKFTSLIDGLSSEELNKTPEGFNNNIAWNYGHAIVSGYLLCYVSSGVEPEVEIPFVNKYRKGSKPEEFAGKEEIETLKKASDYFFSKIEKDWAADKFNNCKPYTTQTFGLEMQTKEEIFTNIFGHDVLHFSMATALKKVL
jgi:hypothetical protein